MHCAALLTARATLHGAGKGSMEVLFSILRLHVKQDKVLPLVRDDDTVEGAGPMQRWPSPLSTMQVGDE